MMINLTPNKQNISFASACNILDRTTLIKYIEEGKTVKEIAELFNVKKHTVTQNLHRYNLKTMGRKKHDARKDMLKDLYEAGETMKEMSKKTGLSNTAITNWFAQNSCFSLKERRRVEKIELCRQNLSPEEIAKKLNLSIITVKDMLKSTKFREMLSKPPAKE